MDVIRLALKNEHNNIEISRRHNGIIIEKLCKYLRQDVKLTNNTVVAIRTLCNLYSYPSGEELICKNKIELIEDILGITPQNKHIEVSEFKLGIKFDY